MHRATLEHGAAGKRPTMCGYRVLAQILYKQGVGTSVRSKLELAFPQPPKLGALALAQMFGRSHDGVQDGLQIVGRSADNAEHVAGRSLVFKGLLKLAFACSASNSRVFSMAMTAWSAKVLSNSICRSVNGRTSVRRIEIAPIAAPARIRGTAIMVRWPSCRARLLPSGYSSVSDCESVM
jgi:hypothetical protein